MFWVYFGYWITAGIVNTIFWSYLDFVSTGKLELKIKEIPILFFAVLTWPIFMIGFTIEAIGDVFEKFGDKSIFKITRKEKK